MHPGRHTGRRCDRVEAGDDGRGAGGGGTGARARGGAERARERNFQDRFQGLGKSYFILHKLKDFSRKGKLEFEKLGKLRLLR